MKARKIVQWSVLFALALVALSASATLAAGTAGGSWDTAVNLVSVNGKMQSLAPGASTWYSIRYTGGMQDEVDLGTNGVGGVDFAIYTASDIAAWASTGVLMPVGIGSYNPDEANFDMTWAGHPALVNGEIYFVQVTNNNSTATQYQLMVSATPLASTPQPD